MGASGNILVVSREAWNQAFPSAEPSTYGFYTGKILGIEAIWGYSGDGPGMYPPVIDANPGQWGPEEDTRTGKEKMIGDWFLEICETHQIWS